GRVARDVVESVARIGGLRHPTHRSATNRRERCAFLTKQPSASRAPRLAKATQAADEQRRVRLRRGIVREAAEQLVVPRRLDAELATQRLLLVARVTRPFRLEGEDRAREVIEAGRARAVA